MVNIYSNYHIDIVAEVLNSKIQELLNIDSNADVEFFNIHEDWVINNGCMKLNKLISYLINNNGYQPDSYSYPLPCGAGYYISGAARAIDDVLNFDLRPLATEQLSELYNNLEFHTTLEVTND